MEEINNKLKELIKIKYKLQSELNTIEKEINKLNENKIKLCKHEWVTEREECMYGERFTYCKYCGIKDY